MAGDGRGDGGGAARDFLWVPEGDCAMGRSWWAATQGWLPVAYRQSIADVRYGLHVGCRRRVASRTSAGLCRWRRGHRPHPYRGPLCSGSAWRWRCCRVPEHEPVPCLPVKPLRCFGMLMRLRDVLARTVVPWPLGGWARGQPVTRPPLRHPCGTCPAAPHTRTPHPHPSTRTPRSPPSTTWRCTLR